ncbi:hypothetical protein [Ereboglobus luteus]|uniref:hypothetical protein n=1 Tax=Ereboglobus luteus TaxID=1796921 RepID=UPI001F33E21D|nr:hypothetical protein [Ereboglobus luteus]
MGDLMTGIWVTTALIAIIGFIPYGTWIVYTAVKKRWKKLGIQVAAPLIIYLMLISISPPVNKLGYKQYLKGLYGTNVNFEPPIFEYNSERAFNGDGYSISVYELPRSIRARFESADEKLFTEHPKRPSYRNHWKVEHWREGPFEEEFKHYLNFALSAYGESDGSELLKQFDAIRQAVMRKGTYYAFFYYAHGEHPGDIDLFIIDITNNRLYSINHNT